MKTQLAAILFAVELVSSATWSGAKTKPHFTPDLTHLSAENLIARFQDEPAASIMEDASADIDPLVAAPPPTGYWADLSGTPFPRVSPTLRELVRRGVAVIPALLDHLSDARPTKLALRGNIANSLYNASYLGNEYDFRQPDADKVPPGLYRIAESEPGHGAEQFKTYRLKVGDLCYAALGQIVNRRLLGLRNWAGIMYGFNSPVHSPALAAAARADWAGVTDDSFWNFLIHDVEWLDKRGSLVTLPRNLAALERLLFYYPKDGVALAVKLLDRPIIDPSAANACRWRLIDTDDEAEQDQLLSDFQAEHGHDDYEYLAQLLALMAARPTNAKDESPLALKRKREDKNELRLVVKHVTEAEKNPTFVESQFDCLARQDVVTALTPYPSAEIDAAIRRLLKRVFALRIEDLLEKERQHDLVLACAEKLLPPGRYKALEQASLSVGRKWDDAQKQEKDVPAYVRACDEFLQKMAAEPALQLPAGQP